MKKKLFAFVFAVLFALSGCSSAEDTSSQTEEESAAVTTNEYDCELIDYSQKFGTYERFSEEFREMHPDGYLYEPSRCSQDWALKEIYYDRYFYIFYFRDKANETDVTLEVNFETVYDSIGQYVDNNFRMGSGRKTLEQTERYAVICSTKDENHELVGITSDLNIFYELSVSPDDETADPIALLKEYKELLEL
ncbi:MAG: hypothetical protein IJ496_06285 [Ruminococcus sp.]|nr:hypothetical protein [Ruminococcus sp.]